MAGKVGVAGEGNDDDDGDNEENHDHHLDEAEKQTVCANSLKR